MTRLQLRASSVAFVYEFIDPSIMTKCITDLVVLMPQDAWRLSSVIGRDSRGDVVGVSHR